MLIMTSDRERLCEVKLINDITMYISELKSPAEPDTVSYGVCGMFNDSRVMTVLSKHNTQEEAKRQIKDFFDNWPKDKYIFGNLRGKL